MKQICNEEWRLVIENLRTSIDPMELKFSLCRIGKNGKILAKDATIVLANANWQDRMVEALKKPAMYLKEYRTEKVEAVAAEFKVKSGKRLDKHRNA